MSCPRLKCCFRTPKVLWYQTDASIVLRIMLTGVESYYLRLDEDHFRFSTIVNEQKYFVCIYLFGAIIPEKCWHSNKGREITVHIPKVHRFADWPRLGIDKKTDPQISYDPDKIEEDEVKPGVSNEEFKACLKEYMRKYNITQILPDGRSSSEAESDDEEMDALFE